MIFLFNWQVIFRFHVNFPGRVPFEQLLGGFCYANALDDPWCFWLATGRITCWKLGEKNRPLKRNRCIFSPFQREHQEGVPKMIQKTHLELKKKEPTGCPYPFSRLRLESQKSEVQNKGGSWKEFSPSKVKIPIDFVSWVLIS